MINFPVFERLDISGYGLYPGVEGQNPGLHIDFPPGLTLVLGANGLGKTTLITIIYRLLTGPFDIPRLEDRSDLGTRRLEPTQLSSTARTIFGQRVVDGARNANASLSFRLGPHTVVIERRLSNLALTQFNIDDQSMPIDEPATFQAEIPRLVGVWSFGDWILLLRYLVFYFEDRRVLVWDPSAQRQILRLLFLHPSTSKQWTEDERDILTLDSRMRNLRAAFNREERALAENAVKVNAGADVRNELMVLESLQETDVESRGRLDSEILEVDAARQHARLRVLRAEQERDAQYRGIERARLLAIGSRFPSKSETARYILAQLLSNQECLVCGNHMPEVAADYSARIEREQCVVCGSDLAHMDVGAVGSTDEIDSAIAQATVDLERIEANLSEARRALQEAERKYHSHDAQMKELSAAISSDR